MNADIPPIDAFFVEEEALHLNPIGTADAIANAVYYATGKRIRDLRITLDKLL
ncbi:MULTISPECIES: hypothetical protein [unclassified Nostoc]|uniref:hypothetical protein n=1 Tax=unclassified Nostoc TaxID=2593658 RepID=UPI001DB501CA|nr:hypothetical protein [Nostoc sp. JL23]MBN3875337.1 hypothetical protein [Nostoc sp. JL23]